MKGKKRGFFCCLILSSAILFLIFFLSFTIPTLVTNSYETTSCQLISFSSGNYPCCFETCSCTPCTNENEQNCSSLLMNNESGNCCIYGISTCSEQVEISNQCFITCPTCYSPYAKYKYFANQQKVYLIYETSVQCQTDQNCVQNFMNNLNLNQIYTCYYDPSNPKIVSFVKGLTSGSILALEIFLPIWFAFFIVWLSCEIFSCIKSKRI